MANVNRPRGGKIDNHLDQNSAPRVKKQEFARSQARNNKGKAFSWEHNMFSLSKDRIDAFFFPLKFAGLILNIPHTSFGVQHVQVLL